MADNILDKKQPHENGARTNKSQIDMVSLYTLAPIFFAANDPTLNTFNLNLPWTQNKEKYTEFLQQQVQRGHLKPTDMQNILEQYTSKNLTIDPNLYMQSMHILQYIKMQAATINLWSDNLTTAYLATAKDEI